MKQIIMTSIIAAVFSSAAFAGNNNNGDTTNNYDQRNYGGNTTNAGGAGGQGGAGGTGLAIAGAASVAEAKANASAMAAQQQGQQQAAIAAQQQSNTNTVRNSNDNSNAVSNNVTVEGSTYEAQKRDPVATAYAASIAPTAVCALSVSGGAQAVGFGFSFGKSFIDENCVLLEQARAAANLGQREIAVEMLMDIPAFAAAKQRVADRAAAQTAGK